MIFIFNSLSEQRSASNFSDSRSEELQWNRENSLLENSHTNVVMDDLDPSINNLKYDLNPLPPANGCSISSKAFSNAELQQKVKANQMKVFQKQMEVMDVQRQVYLLRKELFSLKFKV